MSRHVRHTLMGWRRLTAYPSDFVTASQNGAPAVSYEWKSPTLNFDQVTNEFAYTDMRFIDREPGTWIKPSLWFFPDTIPNGSQGTRTVWRMIIHACRPGDYLPANVGGSITVEGVSPGVLGNDFATEVLFTTNLDVVLRGNLHNLVDSPGPNGRPNLQIELWRVADDGRDTMPGDAKFMKLMFEYVARH